MTPYWQSDDGRHVLYCGDCLALLSEIECDAVVTDPPYGIGFAAQPTNYQRARGMTPQSWDNIAPNILRLLELYLHNETPVFVWGGNYHQLPISRGWLAWVKPDAPPSMGNVELCWTNQNINAKHLQHSIAATNPERVDHPTQKPIDVMLWCLEFIPDAQTILDPFSGSGTTGVACIRTGRRSISIEIEEKYCEIARDRLIRELSQPNLPGVGPEIPRQTEIEA